jgi:ribosomal protein L39E
MRGKVRMPSAKVSVLTKLEIAKAARDFRWNRRMPKWTVIVDGRELPARPLVLQAAGVPPNDPTNSHQAVAILQDRGFDVRYEGKPVHGEHNDRVLEPVSDEFIQSLRGRLKGTDSLVEAWEREHRIEKDRTTR